MGPERGLGSGSSGTEVRAHQVWLSRGGFLPSQRSCSPLPPQRHPHTEGRHRCGHTPPLPKADRSALLSSEYAKERTPGPGSRLGSGGRCLRKIPPPPPSGNPWGLPLRPPLYGPPSLLFHLPAFLSCWHWTLSWVKWLSPIFSLRVSSQRLPATGASSPRCVLVEDVILCVCLQLTGAGPCGVDFIWCLFHST